MRRRRRVKGTRKKRLESLLSFQQGLVEDRGLPPSRLMEQHAAAPALEKAYVAEAAAENTSQEASIVGNAASQCSSSSQSSEKDEGFELFKCDSCDFTHTNQRNVSVHMRQKHKDQDKKSSVTLLDNYNNRFCVKCKTFIENGKSIINHMKEKHRIFKCHWTNPNYPYKYNCVFEASSQNNLDFHINSQH
jgi:RNase P subunit RPR2